MVTYSVHLLPSVTVTFTACPIGRTIALTGCASLTEELFEGCGRSATDHTWKCCKCGYCCIGRSSCKWQSARAAVLALGTVLLVAVLYYGCQWHYLPVLMVLASHCNKCNPIYCKWYTSCSNCKWSSTRVVTRAQRGAAFRILYYADSLRRAQRGAALVAYSVHLVTIHYHTVHRMAAR